MRSRANRATRIGLSALASACLAGCGAATDENRSAESASGFRVEIVASDLSFPASINFAPDGRLFVLERGDVDPKSGDAQPPRLRRLDLATGATDEISGLPESHIYTDAPRATILGGALALELDRDFEANRRIYLCYHYASAAGDEVVPRNRLSAFAIDGERLVGERVLVDDVPGDSSHNGCRVIAGPDGTLYYATGSPRPFVDSQDLGSNAGKILRLLPDGSRPADNPFPNSLVYSYGHRNPQGLAFEPGTNALWSTEHGSRTDDELNLIEAGANYGWPHCGGEAAPGELWGGRRKRPCQGVERDVYRAARKSFYPDRTLAVSDLAFYDASAFPEWRGHVFVATLKARRLLHLELDGDRVVERPDLITGSEAENFGRLRDVTVGPDGFLYVATNPTNANDPNAPPPNPRRGMILRIRPG